MATLIIIPITSSDPEYAEVYDLREEVLRKPIGLSLKNEDLYRDHIDVIITGKQDGKVIACLMLHHIDNHQLQLRQMAVHSQWQGQGMGKQLVLAAEKYAAEKGYNKIILHARIEASGFYHSLGYIVSGNEFLEVGIPHFMMEKQIG